MTKMDPAPRSSSELVSMTQVVAENVRRARTQKGWSQEELRHRLGAVGRLVSRATVAAFESGDRSIGVSDLLALGIAPSRLFQSNATTPSEAVAIKVSSWIH